MVSKFRIFANLTEALQLIGELGGFKVTRGINNSVITGYPSMILS
jgi:hypothetical protein